MPSTARRSLNARTSPSTWIPLPSRTSATYRSALPLRGQAMSETVEITRNLEAWVSFLRSHAAITRELSAQLQRDHDLTINDYECLLHLSQSDEGALRRVDLAER